MEDYGKTIEKIRYDKKIKIKDFCDGIMTRAAYHRFVNGINGTSTFHFFQMLDRLNVSPDEFFIIHNNYEGNFLTQFLEKLSASYRKRDLRGLEELHKLLENQPEPKKTHLTDLLNFRIKRFNFQTIEEKESQLVKYLMKVEDWTRYETLLFSNSMYVFSLDVVDSLLHTCMKKSIKFESLRPYGNDSFRTLLNALIMSYAQKEFEYTKKWTKVMREFKLNENCFYEKLIKTLFEHFYQIVFNKKEELIKETQMLIEFVDKVGSHTDAERFQNMLDDVEKLYREQV